MDNTAVHRYHMPPADLIHIVAQQPTAERNSPLDALPNETLIAIFETFLSGVPLKWHYYGALWTLAQVCGRWWRVIDKPLMWSLVANHMNTNGLEAVLSRSGIIPLEVILNTDWSDFATAVDLIVPHSARWRHLTVRVDVEGSKDKVIALLSARAPILESIDVDTESADISFSDLKCLTSKTIRSLHLSQCTCVWTSVTCDHLEELELRAIGRDAPSIPNVLPMLRSCKLLRRLVLYSLRPD